MYLLIKSSNLLIKKNTNNPKILPFISCNKVFCPLYRIIRSQNGIKIRASSHNPPKAV